MSIKSQGHSLILVKGHSDFKVKCLTFGLLSQVSDIGPQGPIVLAHLSTKSLSAVSRPCVVNFCFKRLLIQNGKTDFEIILQERSLGDPIPKLLKPFRSVERGGRQS